MLINYFNLIYTLNYFSKYIINCKIISVFAVISLYLTKSRKYNQFFSFLSWDAIFIPLWLILPQGISLSTILDTTHIECKTSNLYLNTQWMEKSLEGIYTLFLESNYIAFSRMIRIKTNYNERLSYPCYFT